MENLRKCQGKSLPRSSQGQAQVVSMFFKAGAIWLNPKSECRKTPIHLTPQESLLPLETMSQFAAPVIPDERRFAVRDPESSESSI